MSRPYLVQKMRKAFQKWKAEPTVLNGIELSCTKTELIKHDKTNRVRYVKARARLRAQGLDHVEIEDVIEGCQLIGKSPEAMITETNGHELLTAVQNLNNKLSELKSSGKL